VDQHAVVHLWTQVAKQNRHVLRDKTYLPLRDGEGDLLLEP